MDINDAQTLQLARRVLLIGVRVRVLSARAPFFGDRAAPEVQEVVWAALEDQRAQLVQALTALSEGDPDLQPSLMLEAEGSAENTYNSLMAELGEAPDDLGAGPLPEGLEPTFQRELKVFLSRLEAVHGASNPEHGL